MVIARDIWKYCDVNFKHANGKMIIYQIITTTTTTIICF